MKFGDPRDMRGKGEKEVNDDSLVPVNPFMESSFMLSFVNRTSTDFTYLNN